MSFIRKKTQDLNRQGSRFDTIYRQYFSHIYRFAFRLSGEAEEAKDITQEAFLKLYNYLQTHAEPLDPKAWIFKVAANTSYTLLKRKNRHRKIIENNPGTFSTPFASTPTAEDQIIETEELAVVRNAFNRLPLKERMILELFQSGLSYQEIAPITGVQPSSIGKKLFRARHKLVQEIRYCQKKYEKKAAK